jgi:hypothetical protein
MSQTRQFLTIRQLARLTFRPPPLPEPCRCFQLPRDDPVALAAQEMHWKQCNEPAQFALSEFQSFRPVVSNIRHIMMGFIGCRAAGLVKVRAAT